VHFPTHLNLDLWRQADSQYPPANFLEARFWMVSVLPTNRVIAGGQQFEPSKEASFLKPNWQLHLMTPIFLRENLFESASVSHEPKALL
jgi:hypothetical protein